jgi:CheY-like chemotaxis protein
MPKPQLQFVGMSVVIVDDDLYSLDIAEILLEAAGAVVYTAENGQLGLKKIETVKPQLIVSDISMPVMDGWELIQQIKQNVELKQIPIVALTAHAMSGDREKVLAAGFHNYLSKPLNPSTFAQDLYEIIIDHPAFNTAKKE